MFGYVVADVSRLSEEEKKRYQGCYCGLCSRLGKCCGQCSRLSLQYDCVFLILVLHAVYGGEETETEGRCLPHPFHKHTAVTSRWSDYAAEMNAALGYYKCLDDWNDEKKLHSLFYSKLLSSRLKKIREHYPRQCEAIERELSVLSSLEKAGEMNPDAPANSFGRLMGELFIYDPEDSRSSDLYALGYSLGRFIYLTDAVVDLSEDLKKERYNPLTCMTGFDPEPTLSSLLAGASAAEKRLGFEADRALIENILYSGVWSRYNAYLEKKDKEKEKQ